MYSHSSYDWKFNIFITFYRTPLFGSASECSVEITDLLIKFGADTTIVNDKGKLPLSIETSKKHKQ